MISVVKAMLPKWAKERAVLVRKAIRYELRRRRFMRAAKIKDDLKIILGAAETSQKGWYSTNEQWFDITKVEAWEKIFGDRKPLKAIVAEHVFEHLTEKGALVAFQQAARYLKPGGTIRIAVPDGNHPDPEYLRHVGIKGIGPDAADHKQLYTAQSLMEQMQASGLQPQLQEGYDSEKNLLTCPIDRKHGYVKRSRSNLDTKKPQNWDFIDADTSLIVDGVNP